MLTASEKWTRLDGIQPAVVASGYVWEIWGNTGPHFVVCRRRKRKRWIANFSDHFWEVGGVVIGDVPSWRVDNMPYGGVKDSGLGREGIRFAMEDMTEIRNLVIRTPVK